MKFNKWFYIGALTFLIAGSFCFLFLYHINHVAKQPFPQAQIKHLPVQASSPNNGQQASTPGTRNQGTVKDNNGQSTDSTKSAPAQWIQSQSGVITVKEPIAKSFIASGFVLSGSATTIEKAQYRLIDDKAGVISEGSVNVVGHNFSGSVNFKSFGTSGRLDVFSVDVNGKELNEVQIPVKF